MVMKIKVKLFFLCMILSNLVLIICLLFFLKFSSDQRNIQNNSLLQSTVNSIIFNIQTNNTVDNDFLAKLEASESAVIYLENNEQPLLFPGSWMPKTDRMKLISKAKEVNPGPSERYSFQSHSTIDQTQLIVAGDNADKYRSSIVTIMQGKNCIILIVLKDMNKEISTNNKMISYAAVGYIIGTCIFGFMSIVFANTAIKPIEHNLKSQKEFVSAASHELKSPLTLINTSITSLKSNTQNIKLLDILEKESLRMGKLIDDLLLITNIEINQWLLSKRKVNVDQLLIETVEKHIEYAKAKNFDLKLELPAHVMPHIIGDYDRLQQLLCILINNAIDHSHRECEIIVKGYHDKKRVYIHIIDFGVGIPDNELENVFRKFYKINKNSRSNFGLGLSIAKEIVLMHGGSISIENSGLIGCTVIIVFPTP